MINRIANFIWYGFLIFITVVCVGIPTYTMGVIGFFAGFGLLVTGLLAVILLECAINYIISGNFYPIGEEK